MSVIEDVKQKNDIVEVIGQYTALKKAGRLFRGLCPFHSEKTPSFFVYPEQQSWHCFGACNTGGDVFAFIMKKQGVDFGDALRLLADRSGIALPAYTEKEGEKSEKDRIYEANRIAAQYFYRQLTGIDAAEKARKYLLKRGFDAKITAQFQLGYALNEWDALKLYLQENGFTEKEVINAGLALASEEGKVHDRFRNKLMIPIYDSKGRCCGFGARVLDDSLPKYVNSPQTPVFDKSGSLYGINYAADSIRKQDLVVVVEGYMDVITAHQYGFSNVVASMGTAITEKQINIIKRLTRNVSLALDSDTAGEEAMLRGVNYENSLDAEVKVILLPQGKDPDEVIKEDVASWQKLVADAIPVVDFTMKTAAVGLNFNKVKDKTIFVDNLASIINGIANGVRKNYYIVKLAEAIGSDENSVRVTLGEGSTPSKVRSQFSSKVSNRITKPSLGSPVEEYLLSLLLQHPEIRDLASNLPPEYFESSENRELFLAWQTISDIEGLKQGLDNTMREHLELLLSRSTSDTKITEKYADCSSRLQEKYLRNLEKKKEQVLAAERESGGTDAELAKLAEQGIQTSESLKTIFSQRSQYQKR